MKNAIGLILNVNGEDSSLKDFLHHRSLSTLPFGGRYRLIDFTLSNMVNSGVSHIGVVGSHKYSSLVDHLGTGKEWSLSRKTQDLSILAGVGNNRIGHQMKINLRSLQNNRDYLETAAGEHVIIASPNIVTSFDFRHAYEVHLKNNSDVTLIYKKDAAKYNLEDDDIYLEFCNKRISGIHYKKTHTTKHFYSEMLIIKKSLLIQFMDLSEYSGEWDLLDMITINLDTLRVFGVQHTGYLKRINNLESYMKANMDLLEYDIMQELFLGKASIHTKIKDNHPSLYHEPSSVLNSIVGSGCIIDGTISHSIIFRDVLMERGSQIKNSIIMQKCKIGKHVTLDYVVMDKDSKISDYTVLIGKPEDPIILKKGTVI
ncbi:glucose-1-phosphate adenylyltransferase subunit GlgD [Acetobacterium fimetarium]|uniref:Glucose-1-phosphate adenylyltransferase subunit GlgD n=1 Tax=Acetobacterium fimetarium TaxID=52691 RepID=A0ABR6WT86_9FIRM|nr:glucose-1-phosphate adenylyltransferase subunit GlgD [Acetobacterium fimetarium]MBC3803723.1 glucose-1-phosphate adenylyltransferase subunit GlgD [Acetobacterium fimetarium]